jgi:hypothetical protein
MYIGIGMLCTYRASLKSVKVTITRFRQDLFHLADEALAGKSVQFVHKGVAFQVVPQMTRTSKLDGLVAQPTINPDVDAEQASKKLAAEMEAAWMEDWAGI